MDGATGRRAGLTTPACATGSRAAAVRGIERRVRKDGDAGSAGLEVVGASRDSSNTRFGAWTFTIAGANRGRTGIFGHSNLVASTITADNYSRDVEATYRGRTVAVTGDGEIFDGAHELSADWADDLSGNTVESAIRDMRTASRRRAAHDRGYRSEPDRVPGFHRA